MTTQQKITREEEIKDSRAERQIKNRRSRRNAKQELRAMVMEVN